MSTITAKFKFTSIDWLYRVMIWLTIAGLGVSVYLMWGYTVPGAELACGGVGEEEAGVSVKALS